jgi:glycosyltransferase involved in cell wall biosynthesis
MFLNIGQPIDYADPWLTSYEVRMRQMCARSRRVAYFYEYPDARTFRYRVYNPGLTLAANPDCPVSAAWFDLRDLEADDGFIKEADALVICRARYSVPVARMVSQARVAGIPVLFDCDDLVFDSDRVHLIVDSLNLNQRDEEVWNYWFAVVSRTSAVLQLCDTLLTSNAFLAYCANEYRPQLSTAIVPNYLNPDQQVYSERLYAAKCNGGWARDGRIHIGYFSGTPSHDRDFAIVAPAICRLMEADPRVMMRVVGCLSPNQELLKYRDRIEFIPLQDFMNLQRLIAEVEINIAPLQDNVFTNCKSELKFFEAAICGTLTLASPTFAFRNAIEHGRTGLLVPPYDWDEALHQAVAMVDNMNHYQAIARDAFSYAQLNYGSDQHAETIVRAVFGSGPPAVRAL